MKKSLALFAALLLAACGDEVTQINQTGLEVYSAEKDLPKCSDKNEGEQAYVKGESFARVCDGEDWVALDGSSSDFACKTEELKDKSGLKIVCNGDSIGVVLNGSDGRMERMQTFRRIRLKRIPSVFPSRSIPWWATRRKARS